MFQQRHGSVRNTQLGIERDYALKGIDQGQAAAIEVALFRIAHAYENATAWQDRHPVVRPT